MKFNPNDFVVCDETDCLVIMPQSKAQQVKSYGRVKGRKGITTQDFCPAHRRPYDMHTTSSGYDRYYDGGKEIVLADSFVMLDGKVIYRPGSWVEKGSRRLIA